MAPQRKENGARNLAKVWTVMGDFTLARGTAASVAVAVINVFRKRAFVFGLWNLYLELCTLYFVLSAARLSNASCKVQSTKYKILSTKIKNQIPETYPNRKCSVVSPRRSLSPLSKTRGWRGASLTESLITVPLTDPRSSTRNVSPSRQIRA